MRLRVFLPESLRVVAQRLEADMSALRRSLSEPRHKITVPRSGKVGRRVSPMARHVAVERVAEKNQGSFGVRFEDGAYFVVGVEETILQAGLRAGLDLEFSCTLGGCGACMLEVLQGEVTYEDREAVCLSDQEIEDGWCLACVGRPLSPLQLRR